MGNLSARLGNRAGENLDVADPLSGLTKRDVLRIQKSWKPVYKERLANGFELFTRFFRADGEAKNYFVMIKNVREPQYPDVVQFRVHVIGFMTSLNMVISHLDKAEEVQAMMHKLGKSHNSKGIEKLHFTILKDVLRQMLAEQMMLDGETMASWERAIDFWWQCLYERIDEPYARKSRRYSTF